MKRSIKVGASILCADFTHLQDEIKVCEDAGIDRIHVDVMDGHFVPNITIGQVIVKAMRPSTNLPISAHLMIENPWTYLDSFLDAGADHIYVHAECYGERKRSCKNYGEFPKEISSFDEDKLEKDINIIHEKGKKAYVVLNPGTSENILDQTIKMIDGVLVMSVNPGFANQKFMPEVLPKIKQLRERFDGDIEIDGGINAETAPGVVEAGANILSTASYFFGSKNKKIAVNILRSLGEKN